MDQIYFLPTETRIYNSKASAVFSTILLLSFSYVGYLLCTRNFLVFGFGLIALCIAGLVIVIKIFIDKKPQVVISDQGIFSIKNGFHSWENLSYERVIRTEIGTKISYYLQYYYQGKKIRVNLAWLKIEPEEVQQLLIKYRSAFESL